MQTAASPLAVEKLNTIIANGAARMTQGLEAMAREFGMRNDFVVKPSAIDVSIAGDEDPTVDLTFDGKVFRPTHHARGQFLQASGIPSNFADHVLKHDPELLRENVRRLLPRVSPEGLLVRTVGDTAKGVLSPSYRRMDASPIFEEFAKVALRNGLVPNAGQVTDTRCFLSFVKPEIVTLATDEHVVFGAELRTSDYGNGALQLTITILRLLCLNGLIGTDVLRKVHLGRRFEAADRADVVALSSRTIALDTATVRSALADSTKALGNQMKALEGTLRETVGNTELNLPAALQKLTKAGVKKEIVERVKTMYGEQLPVEAVPQAPGAWRFAQIAALIAKSEQGDAAKDLEEAAFRAIA